MAFIKQQAPQAVNEDERTAKRDFGGLSAELNSDNATARRWAVRDLVTFPQASDVLVARLKIEEDVSVRTAILSSLAQLGDKVALNGLVTCLRSDEASLRNEAIEVLKAIPDEVGPIINTLLHDNDSDVRIFTINILESLRHDNVEQWLMSVIDNDDQVNVCATAVDLLSEVGTELSIQSLINLKQRFANEPYMCFSVDLALKRIEQGEH
ncbi:MAG: hypothetical protein QG557_955 [Pseudomonadota bacterium]|jgi:HEAT repeat protein|nr:hypothetical protein [Pseudomonadota bacterium]